MLLKQRTLRPELMDQPGLDSESHQQALRGLSRINRVSGSSRLLWRPIRRLCQQTGQTSWRVLDIASGGGDVPIDLYRKAVAAGVSLQIVGYDISATAVDHATCAASGISSDVRFEQRDIFGNPPTETFDIVTCSLFLHHLPANQATQLLRMMTATTGRLMLVNDLVRSLSGYALAHLACQLLTRSRIVHVDGPRSVAGAFSLAEVKSMCQQARLTDVHIYRRWPCRFVLEWMARIEK